MKPHEAKERKPKKREAEGLFCGHGPRERGRRRGRVCVRPDVVARGGNGKSAVCDAAEGGAGGCVLRREHGTQTCADQKEEMPDGDRRHSLTSGFSDERSESAATRG